MVDGTSVAAVCSLVVALVHVPLSILSGSQCSGLAGFLKFVKGFIMSCTVVQIDLGTTAFTISAGGARPKERREPMCLFQSEADLGIESYKLQTDPVIFRQHLLRWSIMYFC